MKVVIALCAAAAVAACGVIGTPIPPEDVGIAPLIERQNRADAEAVKRKGEEAPTLEPQGQDVDLPPLRPVGTR